MGGFSFAREVAAMLEFVLMCGRLASHHDTALAHAMLHAVAVWAAGRGGKD